MSDANSTVPLNVNIMYKHWFCAALKDKLVPGKSINPGAVGPIKYMLIHLCYMRAQSVCLV